MPPELILLNPAFRPEMLGIEPPNSVYAHIAGIDLIRTGERDFFVLEDNVRTPSGVSYVLENREIMMRLFPDAFAGQSVSPVGNYPERLLENLRAVAPSGADDPVVVLLTPGRYNSAYFEHVFLAEQMGIELVEGGDLFVRDGYVWMRTTEGPVKVDVIYRRVDDVFMDPLAFRSDPTLGVPGLLSVIRGGRVALANALGTGVADDKAMYVYVPRMIEFYLGEHAILNNVHTYMLREPKQRQHVFDNLHKLVVKEVQGSGGYGMLIGPASTAEEREAYKLRVMRNPDNYIAQPTLALSTAPTLIDGEIGPRHVDLQALRALGQGDECDPRRLDPRSTSQRLPSGQFEPGRRHQGHLGSGARLMLSRTAGTCSGWPATWSGQRTPRACSTSPSAWRFCPRPSTSRPSISSRSSPSHLAMAASTSFTTSSLMKASSAMWR